jgi:hypothetical protein
MMAANFEKANTHVFAKRLIRNAVRVINTLLA